jgi:hypothetical protein
MPTLPACLQVFTVYVFSPTHDVAKFQSHRTLSHMSTNFIVEVFQIQQLPSTETSDPSYTFLPPY